MNTLHLKKIDRVLGGALVHLLPKPKRSRCSPEEIKQVLFIRPGGIGDAALLGHTLARLRRVRPGVAIDVLAERRNAGAFLLLEGLRNVYLYDRPRDWLRFLRSRYDVVVDSEQWYRLSAVVARLIRSPVKIGFATNERGRMFTHAIAYSLEERELDSFGRLLAPIGISSQTVLDDGWLTIPAETKQKNVRHGNEGASSVVLFPGASIPEKRWGAERFRAVSQWCLNQGFAVTLVGGQGDREEAKMIADGLNIADQSGRVSLVDTAVIIDQSSVIVGGDSGVLHIAVGLGRPTVSLYGPSSVSKWAPRGSRHRVLVKQLDCSPCSRFGNIPPCHCNVRCMREISVDEVTKAIAEILSPPVSAVDKQ